MVAGEGKRMVRVLIADDEVLSIRYMKKLISWEELGYEIVGEAANGKKALELFEKTKAQIVISDIRMPVMDGVELAAELRKRDDRVKIILVSAFKDFEYAKRAIRFNVSNYLLKHELSSESLGKELESVRLEIEKDVQMARMSAESQFKDILYGKAGGDSFSKENERFGNQYVMMVLREKLPIVERRTAVSLERRPNRLWEEVVSSARSLDMGSVQYVTGVSLDEENQLLLFGVRTNSMRELHDGIWKFYYAFLKIVERVGEYGVCFVYSNVLGIGKMPEVFRALSYAVRYTAFMEAGKLYELKDIPVSNPDVRLHLRDKLTDLEMCIKSGSEESVKLLDELFEMVMKPFWNLTEFRYLLKNLDSVILSNMKKSGIVLSASEQECFTVKECRRYYSALICRLSEQVHIKRSGSYSKAVGDVLDYVHERYNEDITLDTAGNVCGLNGVYLGQVFKKEVGISLSKYLTNYRCEQAKRLLLNGNYTVVQISERVGYQTSQYFSRTFRKVTGMTPQEYRNGGGIE